MVSIESQVLPSRKSWGTPGELTSNHSLTHEHIVYASIRMLPLLMTMLTHAPGLADPAPENRGVTNKMMLDLKKQAERTQHKTLPLHKQLTLALIEAILQGEIKPGESLPSSRKMAKQLSISRCTVNNSYEELISLGFIETAPCKSVYVSKSFQTDFSPGYAEAKSYLDKVSHTWFHNATT